MGHSAGTQLEETKRVVVINIGLSSGIPAGFLIAPDGWSHLSYRPVQSETVLKYNTAIILYMIERDLNNLDKYSSIIGAR